MAAWQLVVVVAALVAGNGATTAYVPPPAPTVPPVGATASSPVLAPQRQHASSTRAVATRLPLAGGGKGKDGPFRVVAKNKQASRNYEILETFEAGIELLGTEVKSARDGRCSIDEGYASAKRGECMLHGVHIAPHATSNTYFQHEAKRPRRLLLHKREINRLETMTSQAGFTAVPLTLYFNHKNLLKISIALAKGKNTRDKRDDIQKREVKRDIQRALKFR